jgi:hypothetical protein
MRRHISAELKKVALRLAVVKGYKYKKIRRIPEISEISKRTTQRLRALHRHTGDVVQRRTVDGRPRILNGFEISVDDLDLHHGLLLKLFGSLLKVALNNSQI